jgi:hypothetical protein
VLVDASNQCNVLSFQLGVNAIGTTVASRSWNLKVQSTFGLFCSIELGINFTNILHATFWYFFELEVWPYTFLAQEIWRKN